MKQTGAKQPNQKVLWGILWTTVAGCVVYLYQQFATPTPTVPPPAPVVVSSAPVAANPVAVTRTGPAARPVPGMKAEAARSMGTIGQLDPSLHMAAMEVTESLAYAGSGRNIFSPNSAPPPIPRVVAPVRTQVQAPPPLPVSTRPPPPPPPPPIDLKFFGTSTSSKGKREAFLLHGDEVSVAGEGEVVSRRYKVITVGTNSVVVEDMQYDNRQTLPVEGP